MSVPPARAGLLDSATLARVYRDRPADPNPPAIPVSSFRLPGLRVAVVALAALGCALVVLATDAPALFAPALACLATSCWLADGGAS